jgi:glutaminyl-tRNA synthetase
LYIEQEDFREDPPRQFFRLAPGREVRLRSAYFVRCHSVVKNAAGDIVELHCTYDPATRGGDAPDGRKVKSTLHWVSASHALPAEVRLYDYLFDRPDPDNTAQGQDSSDFVRPESLQVLTDCQVEPGLAAARAGDIFQFERQGYFCVDPDSRPGRLVFNRSVSLRDTWAKVERGQKAVGAGT